MGKIGLSIVIITKPVVAHNAQAVEARIRAFQANPCVSVRVCG